MYHNFLPHENENYLFLLAFSSALLICADTFKPQHNKNNQSGHNKIKHNNNIIYHS